MKGKVLITGGTGFIGYHLSKEFLKRNYKVTSISLTKPKKIRYLRNMNYLYCDLGNYNALKKTIVGDFDYVINLAGHVDHTNKAKVINSHFNGCKNLSTIFLKRKIKGFFQIGSCVEYGYKASPQKENAKIKLNTIRSNYGISQYLATTYLLNLHQKKKFPVIILAFMDPIVGSAGSYTKSSMTIFAPGSTDIELSSLNAIPTLPSLASIISLRYIRSPFCNSMN